MIYNTRGCCSNSFVEKFMSFYVRHHNYLVVILAHCIRQVPVSGNASFPSAVLIFCFIYFQGRSNRCEDFSTTYQGVLLR